MKAYQKVLMIVAALSLGLLFLFPMWKIYLQAPQYPEGLEMHIWINKISGNTDGALQNFNILNHYIGMEPIHADSFAELTIMPYIVIFFMVAGVLVALSGKRKLVLSWAVLLMVAGAVGILDFYMWLEKFGTNLDPTAPIKVPGMTYVPPLLGSKQLLNFDALSLPALGSLGIFLAITISALVYFVSRAKTAKYKTKESTGMRRLIHNLLMAAMLLTLLVACQVEPKPIAYGEVNCAHCHMTVSDNRYGAELVNDKGKPYYFDSAECLAEYLHEQPEVGEKAAFVLVTDFTKPNELIEARNAQFLQSKALPSPMGMYLTAVADQGEAAKLQQEAGGRLLNWEEAKQAVKNNEKPE